MATSLLCSHLSNFNLQWIAKEPVYDIQLEPTLENYLYTLDNATCKFSRMPLSVPATKNTISMCFVSFSSFVSTCSL